MASFFLSQQPAAWRLRYLPLLSLLLLGCALNFVTDEQGAGGNLGSDGSGGQGICCGGHGGGTSVGATGGVSGAPIQQAAGGNPARGLCEGKKAYCAFDWSGVWNEPGFAFGELNEARFSGVKGIASSEASIFLAHQHAVSIVDRGSFNVRLLAGALLSGDVDSVGEQARFNSPTGIVHHEGFLYVADTGNRKIRRVSVASGAVETYSSSLLSGPTGLEIWPRDGTRPPYLLVADETLHIIVRIEIAAVAPTPGVLAGSLNQPGKNSVLLDRPYGLARMDNILFITERGNHQVRSINLSLPAPSSLDLQWGRGSAGFSEGPGAWAGLNDPTAIARVGNHLLVVDAGNHVIRSGTPGGDLKLIVGQQAQGGHREGEGDQALIDQPHALHPLESGFALFADDAVLMGLTLE